MRLRDVYHYHDIGKTSNCESLVSEDSGRTPTCSWHFGNLMMVWVLQDFFRKQNNFRSSLISFKVTEVDISNMSIYILIIVYLNYIDINIKYCFLVKPGAVYTKGGVDLAWDGSFVNFKILHGIKSAFFRCTGPLYECESVLGCVSWMFQRSKPHCLWSWWNW